MNNVTYCAGSEMAAIRMLVGVWRHSFLCAPGMYRIAICADAEWGFRHCDAVVDDFGDLVRVS